jgi:hypothetical protein
MKDIMYDWDLVDIDPKKGKYSWTNRRLWMRNIVSILYHFLIHCDFLLDNQVIPSHIILP